MNIITKKRGRVAVSWVVCLTMIFASFAGPFSQMDAQASTSDGPITVHKVVTDPTWTDKNEGIAQVKLTVDSENITTVIQTELTTRIVLVLDYSGSMKDKISKDGPTKIELLRTTAKKFVDDMLPPTREGVEIGIVLITGTDDGPQILTLPFTNVKADLYDKINSTPTGGTFTQGGIRKAKEMLDTVTANNEFMIVLSDGVPTYSYKGDIARNVEQADRDLNYINGAADWPFVLTHFSNDLVGTGGDYKLKAESKYDSYKQYMVPDNNLVTNNGIATVSEALLAKLTGTTIYSIAYGVADDSDAANVMKSVASPGKNYLSGDDLSIDFETIKEDIVTQAAGTGAIVTDPMGFDNNFAGDENYQFDALIDGTHPVVISYQDKAVSPTLYDASSTELTGKLLSPDVTSSYEYDTVAKAFKWVLVDGDIKAGTYTLTYYVKLQGLNGNGVGDNVLKVKTNHGAVLAYTTIDDDVSKDVTKKFDDPILKVTHYSVEYYFNGEKDDSKTTVQAAIAGSSAVVVSQALKDYGLVGKVGFKYDNTQNSPLAIVQNRDSNVMKIYYVSEKGSLTVNKQVLKNGVASAVTDTFTFGLFSDALGATAPLDTKTVTLTNESTGDATFTDLIQGTPYYVFELDDNKTPIKKPIPNIGSSFVTDGDYLISGQGQSFTPSASKLSDSLTIYNNMVDTTVNFKGTKNLTGRYLPVEDNFFFKVLEGETTVAFGTTGTFLGSMNTSKSFLFNTIEYGLKDVGTHHYIVEELDKGVTGLTYDPTLYEVEVKVGINDLGKMTADVKYPGEQTELVFNNSYTAKQVTWTPEVTKALTGRSLNSYKDGTFTFTIIPAPQVSARVIQSSEPVGNIGNKIPFGSITFTTPGTYIYNIQEVNTAVPGITYDENIIKVKVVVTDDGKGNLVAKAEYEGGQVFNNSYKGPGSIEVTKKTVALTDDPTFTVTNKFFVALFEDQDGRMVKVSDVKVLDVVKSADAKALFDGLDLDKTYYVYETTADGTILQNGDLAAINPIWTNIAYDVNKVTLNSETANQMYGSTVITNTFDPIEFPLTGEGTIRVNKSVMVGNDVVKSNQTFYVALFSDKEMTKIASEVKAIKMNGEATAFVTFDKDKSGEPLFVEDTYYVAETDKDGVPLTGTVAAGLGFEIQIDKSMAVVTKEGTNVNIINKFKATDKKTEEFPLTGDNSNMSLWLFLAMIGVAGAIAPLAFRKKEETND